MHTVVSPVVFIHSNSVHSDAACDHMTVSHVSLGCVSYSPQKFGVDILAACCSAVLTETGGELLSVQFERKASLSAMLGQNSRFSDISIRKFVAMIGADAITSYPHLMRAAKYDSYNIQWKQQLPEDTYFVDRVPYVTITEAEEYVLKFLSVWDAMVWATAQGHAEVVYFKSNYDTSLALASCFLSYIVPRNIYRANIVSCLSIIKQTHESKKVFLQQARQTGKTTLTTLMWAALLAVGHFDHDQLALLCTSHNQPLSISNKDTVYAHYINFMKRLARVYPGVRAVINKCKTTRFLSVVAGFRTSSVRKVLVGDPRGQQPSMVFNDETLHCTEKLFLALMGIDNVDGRKFVYTSTPGPNPCQLVLDAILTAIKSNNNGDFSFRVIKKGVICDDHCRTDHPHLCMCNLAYVAPWTNLISNIHKFLTSTDRNKIAQEKFGVNLQSSARFISADTIDRMKRHRPIPVDVVREHCNKSRLHVSVDPMSHFSSWWAVQAWILSDDNSCKINIAMDLLVSNDVHSINELEQKVRDFIARLREHPAAYRYENGQRHKRVIVPWVEGNNNELTSQMFVQAILSSVPSYAMLREHWAADFTKNGCYITTKQRKNDMFNCLQRWVDPNRISVFRVAGAMLAISDKSVTSHDKMWFNWIKAIESIHMGDTGCIIPKGIRDDGIMCSGMFALFISKRLSRIFTDLHGRKHTQSDTIRAIAMSSPVVRPQKKPKFVHTYRNHCQNID